MKTTHPLQEKVERGLEALRRLSKAVLEGTNPPSGAYAFFNHNSHALTALQDCSRIYQRLHAGRQRLTALAYEEERILPKDLPAGQPHAEPVQEVMRQSSEANEYMKLDLESLYIFGGVLLDQWSFGAIAIGQVSCQKKNPFRELVGYLEDHPNSILNPLERFSTVMNRWGIPTGRDF